MSHFRLEFEDLEEVPRGEDLHQHERSNCEDDLIEHENQERPQDRDVKGLLIDAVCRENEVHDDPSN